jgi:hypothetical protein
VESIINHNIIARLHTLQNDKLLHNTNSCFKFLTLDYSNVQNACDASNSFKAGNDATCLFIKLPTFSHENKTPH